MVTKYDLFEVIYSKGKLMSVVDFLGFFKKNNYQYHVFYQMLLDLEKDGVIANTKKGFQAVRSVRSDLLYQLILYCIKNGINYNYLLDKNLTLFVSLALQKSKFSFKDFKINQRTYKKYLDILSRSGLCIILSRRPLVGSIPYNSYLRDLLSYFGHVVLVAKRKNQSFYEDIEKEMKKFKRLVTLDERKYAKFMNEFKIKFIYHSLSLEGNPITLTDTISLIKNDITPKDARYEDVQEVKNYQEAVELMLLECGERKILTKSLVLNYHYLAMRHKSQIAGRLRLVPVHIQGNPEYKVGVVEELDDRVDELLMEYNIFLARKKVKVKEIIEFSAYFHNEFQHIHPFEDGNSRTTRLLTFHFLRYLGIPILDIPLGMLEEYLFSTKGAKKRDDKKLALVFQRIVLYNLKVVNQRLR